MTAWRGAAVRFCVFLLVIAGCTYVIVTALRSPVKGTTHDYSAVFSDVSGLFVGNDVRIAGVPVGKVTAIELEDPDARVTFTVLDSQPVYSNTRAAVLYQDLVGQRYVGLANPEQLGSVLAVGSEIPVDRTTASFDVTKLFNGFGPLFDTLDPAALNLFAQNMLRVIQGDPSGIAPVLTDIEKLSKFAKDREGLIVLLIDNLGAISDQIGGKSQQVGDLIHQLEVMLSKFTSQIGGIVDAVKQANRALVPAMSILEELQATYDDNYLPIDALLHRLLPQTGQIVDVLSLLPGVLAALNQGLPAEGPGTQYTCSAGNVDVPGIGNVILGNQRLVVCK
jgi:phospholipid/cholesterol/gamma-HCH transport system substrate-binding protein